MGLQIGDVVRLKTGGKTMAVVADRDNDHKECVWHSEDGYPQREIYPAVALEPVGAQPVGSR